MLLVERPPEHGDFSSFPGVGSFGPAHKRESILSTPQRLFSVWKQTHFDHWSFLHAFSLHMKSHSSFWLTWHYFSFLRYFSTVMCHMCFHKTAIMNIMVLVWFPENSIVFKRDNYEDHFKIPNTLMKVEHRCGEKKFSKRSRLSAFTKKELTRSQTTHDSAARGCVGREREYTTLHIKIIHSIIHSSQRCMNKWRRSEMDVLPSCWRNCSMCSLHFRTRNMTISPSGQSQPPLFSLHYILFTWSHEQWTHNSKILLSFM